MNFKILIALIILPFSVMAQNRTNEMDNAFIKRGLTFTGGTPGSGKVLTSDAAGNYTPQTPAAATGPFAVTNANNLFTTTSTNTFNAQTFYNSGIFYKLVVTPTNYFASTTDYAIMFKGTTATQVTNFLPAISTTVTNGFTLIIADEQQSAGTTNIVVLPSGADTINLTTNKYINVNGASIDVIVDAVNKNWKIK